ncbi:hypothetical protein EH244_17830 [Variovorax beijingensis]|uniref:Uncharacterized protein n=1 Tax=Variovorax beijingensis TaxID=2496117 RepID=A0A3P3ENG9_9BURK|nr:hypothetical protein [Variovorax beijingensis]RRH87352.1 hypothetical protein EH244_17830 [Variovorax beijingensis]RSZ35643.1 hypothetical protein EJO66_16800 [Variovorax beijingensis]
MTSSEKAFPFPTSKNHGKPPVEPTKPTEQATSEEALDSGVEESFPASDPVSVTVTKVKLPKAPQDKDKAEQGRNADAKR